MSATRLVAPDSASADDREDDRRDAGCPGPPETPHPLRPRPRLRTGTRLPYPAGKGRAGKASRGPTVQVSLRLSWLTAATLDALVDLLDAVREPDAPAWTQTQVLELAIDDYIRSPVYRYLAAAPHAARPPAKARRRGPDVSAETAGETAAETAATATGSPSATA